MILGLACYSHINDQVKTAPKEKLKTSNVLSSNKSSLINSDINDKHNFDDLKLSLSTYIQNE